MNEVVVEPLPEALSGLETQVDALREVGRQFHHRGWSLGTSSNYSVVLEGTPLQLLVTASGMDKGRLRRRDFVRVDAAGQPSLPAQPKSSAETLLHVVVARRGDVGAVLHTHSVWGTLLSDLGFAEGGLEIAGYEMLKGLQRVATHDHREWIPIFDNTQEIPQLAAQLEQYLADPTRPEPHGYLIRKHGLSTWGRDLAEAVRHVEIFEFLLECEARRRILTGMTAAAVAD